MSRNPFLQEEYDSDDDGYAKTKNRGVKSVKSSARNPFSDGPEEINDSDFLRSAPSRPWSGNSHSKHDDQLQSLIEKKKAIEERTLQSSVKSLGMLHETEQVGSQTAEELIRQREQLEKTNNRLDDMNQQLRVSERHIQNIKSVFSSVKNYFSKPLTAPPAEHAVKPSQSSSSLRTAIPPLDAEKKLATEHPAMRIKGLSDASDSQNFESPLSVDEQLDRNLGDMSSALSRLKGLGIGLRGEIEEQNSLLERINDKADKVDWKLGKQNKDMGKILKK